MVGVPEIAPRAPFFFELAAGSIIQFALLFVQGFGIEAAEGADAAIAREDLLAEIAWIGAQPPLMHASCTAEGKASLRNCTAAPAAGCLLGSFDPAARHGSEAGARGPGRSGQSGRARSAHREEWRTVRQSSGPRRAPAAPTSQARLANRGWRSPRKPSAAESPATACR